MDTPKLSHSSAALGALVASAVGWLGDIGHASLAVDMVLVLVACISAIAITLGGGCSDCALVSWSTLDEADCLVEGLTLGLAVCLTLLEVLSDEVTTWLDLGKVIFDFIPVVSG